MYLSISFLNHNSGDSMNKVFLTRFVVVCVTLLFFSSLHGLQSAHAADPLPSSAEGAEQVAKKAHEAILKKAGNNAQFRVAVFPFGDSENKVTIPLGSESLNLQGELMFHLRKLGSGKYFVLDKAGLAREFKDKGLDPAGVKPGDPTATAKILKDLGIDGALLGAMQGSKKDEFVKLDPISPSKDVPVKSVSIEATLVFQDGSSNTDLSGKFDGRTLPDPTPGRSPQKPSGRFTVEMVIDGKAQELRQGDYPNDDAKHHNVFFVVLPEKAKGKEYTLKIANLGSPKTPFVQNADDAKDRNRLFGVAVKVDGVNSIYQDTGDGKEGPVVLHPKNCKKWILTAPGKVVKGLSGGGFAVVDVTGGQDDHSVRPIPGFQKGEDKADVFTLGSARESIAETVGITNSIGLIEVHIYPQKLDDDVLTFSNEAGTKAGREITHGVQSIKLTLHENPVEVWRIFYRYDGGSDVEKTKPVITKK